MEMLRSTSFTKQLQQINYPAKVNNYQHEQTILFPVYRTPYIPSEHTFDIHKIFKKLTLASLFMRIKISFKILQLHSENNLIPPLDKLNILD